MSRLKLLTRRCAGTLLLLTVACGDDSNGEELPNTPEDGGATDAATGTGDAGTPGGNRDGAVGTDGAVEMDGGDTDMDGSLRLDGSTEDAGASDDAGATGDGGAADAGAQPADAAQMTDATVAPDSGPQPGPCDIEDPRFGCGRVSGTWVQFDEYSVDRATGLVWAPVNADQSDNQHTEGCASPGFEGVGEFMLPTIDQVRTLAAGCEPSCELSSSCTGEACQSGCEACTGGQGPHASGGYCRPELEQCSPIFTRNACDLGPRAGCDVHRHWYYDPATGLFDLVEPGMLVNGRCVAEITGELP